LDCIRGSSLLFEQGTGNGLYRIFGHNYMFIYLVGNLRKEEYTYWQQCNPQSPGKKL